MLEATNTTDDFMSTLSFKTTKEEVNAKYKTQFETHYAKNATFEEEKQQICSQIQNHMMSFNQVLGQI